MRSLPSSDERSKNTTSFGLTCGARPVAALAGRKRRRRHLALVGEMFGAVTGRTRLEHLP